MYLLQITNMQHTVLVSMLASIYRLHSFLLLSCSLASQMGHSGAQYLRTHRMGNFILRRVSLLQPNHLPIFFGCDNTRACCIWEICSVKWFSGGFFFSKGSSLFFQNKKVVGTGSTTDHQSVCTSWTYLMVDVHMSLLLWFKQILGLNLAN